MYPKWTILRIIFLLIIPVLTTLLPAQNYPAKTLTIGNRYYIRIIDGNYWVFKSEQVSGDTLIQGEKWYVIDVIEKVPRAYIFKSRKYQRSTADELFELDGTTSVRLVDFTWQAGDTVEGRYIVAANDTSVFYYYGELERIVYSPIDYNRNYYQYFRHIGFRKFVTARQTYPYDTGPYSHTLLATEIDGIKTGETAYLEDLHPVIVSTPSLSTRQGVTWGYDFESDFYDKDRMFYWVDGPAWVKMVEDLYLRGTPPEDGIYQIALSISDLWGHSNTQSFELKVETKVAPVITSQPDTAAYVNIRYEYQIAFTHPDPDGTFIYQWLEPAPSWLSIDDHGLISGTPQAADVGEYHLSYSAGYNNKVFGGTYSTTQEFTLTVHPEIFLKEYPAKDLTIGNRYYYRIREDDVLYRAEEVAGDTILNDEQWYIIQGIEKTAGERIVTFNKHQLSTDVVLYDYSGSAKTKLVDFSWNAGETVTGGYVAIDDTNIFLGEKVLRIRVDHIGPTTSSQYTFHTVFGNTEFSFSSSAGGSRTETLIAARVSGVERGASQYIRDLSPQITSHPILLWKAGRKWSYYLNANYDQDLVHFTVDGPDWLTLVEGRSLEGIPPENGTYPINVNVSDCWGNRTTQSFQLMIVPEIPAPLITSIPDTITYVNQLYEYQIELEHPDSNGVFNYYWQQPAPAWIFLDENGLISGTPKNSDIGTYLLSYSVKYWNWGFINFSDPAVQTYLLSVLSESVDIDTTSSDTTTTDTTDAGVTGISLFQNFPNPFSGKTTIAFALPHTATVELRIFNILGETADLLVSGTLPQGVFQKEWQPKNLSKGIYYYRIRIDNQVLVRKMILF